MEQELPIMVEQGITSVKLYMTYDPLKLRDREILNIMLATRALGMTTMMHAENSDMIDLIIEQRTGTVMRDHFQIRKTIHDAGEHEPRQRHAGFVWPAEHAANLVF